MPESLGALASRFGCELKGDPDTVVSRVASLHNAGDDALSFFASEAYRPQLATTRAAAVVLRPADLALAPGAALISANPYASYARMAAVLYPPPSAPAGIHPSAVVADTAEIAEGASIGPKAVVAERARIASRAIIGAGAFVGPECDIASDVLIHANVSLVRAVRLGARTIVHSGAVIGADGFGNAMTDSGWLKVPQVGGVRIGCDVEIGANTTIDCGAVDDTVIEDGVRIDNLCMLAHNVRIGAHTAIAAMVGIAGSTVVGQRCMFAGQAGVVGHISICDDVIVSGQAVVSKDITEPGTYAGSFTAENARDWMRRVARFKRLGALTDRVRKLERGDS
ncbi:MAG: UDP-3-O-(3-hydroxymyristoyl)glucosamine N-acyltransferase [Pseudomonadota bacterium]